MSYKGDAFIITSVIMTAANADTNLDEAAESLSTLTRRTFGSEVASNDFLQAVEDQVDAGNLTKDTTFIEALGIIGPIVEEYKCY